MKKKILVVQFRHESNSFCPVPADEQHYRNVRFKVGDKVFSSARGGSSELCALLNIMEKRDDIELVPTVGLVASPSGPVTADVYNFVVNEVTKVIKEKGPFDGVFYHAHGAMVAEGHQDGEGDLLEIIRNLVGWDIPVMLPLDLHANVTDKMASHATALVPFECYPHIDTYETGLFTARLFADTLDGKVNPVMAYRKIPFLLPLFPSEFPEMKVLYQKAAELKKRKGALSVRFTHGFFPADIEEMGMAVLTITDGDKELAEEIADELAKTINENIPNLKRVYPSLDEALDRAILDGDKPVVIADGSDNPGAGGVGDTTHILRRILERKITGAVIATILDPASVEACIKAGVGATVELNLGGYSDPVYSGGPLKVNAYVKMLTDGKYVAKGKMSQGSTFNHGKTAVVNIEGNTVLINSFPRQPRDLELLISHGITPGDYKILVTKSAVHYRDSFGPVAREMIDVALPGYATPVPDGFKFKRWRD